MSAKAVRGPPPGAINSNAEITTRNTRPYDELRLLPTPSAVDYTVAPNEPDALTLTPPA